MIKNYFKIFLKNFSKNKLYSLINICGLAIGLGTFIIGLLYLNHEWAYDKGFEDYQNIYRVETVYADGHISLFNAQPMSDIFQAKCPDIESLTKFMEISIIQPLLKVSEEKSIYLNHLYYTDSSFFKIFDFSFLYGNRLNAFSQPNAIILSKDVAYKLFNDTDPVGKTVIIGDEGNFIVTGVFDNTKFPTHLSPDAVRLMTPSTDLNLWKANPTYTYLKLRPYSKTYILEEKLTTLYREAFLDQYNKSSVAISQNTIVLQPLANIYLHSHTEQEISKNGSETGIWLVACLIAFMLLVSAINFTNLNVSEAPLKAKEIAIRRFLGSSRISILKQLYLEMLIKCFIALIIALLIVALALPTFNNVISNSFSLFENSDIKIWLQIITLLLLVVLVAGTYPVLYISYFQPATVLKGNFIHSSKGNGVRNGLLITQFTITSIFIIGVLIISHQVTFLRNKDLGFNPQQILVIHFGQLQTQYRYDFIKDQLSKIPGVQNISYTSAVGNPNEQVTMNLTVKGEEYNPKYICVDTGYFDLMGAPIISGRDFSETFGDSLNSLIINQTLANELGIKKVDSLNDIKFRGTNLKIIGIAGDLNFYGFENKIGPMAFTTMKRLTLTPFILLKLNTNNLNATIQSIQSVWKNIEPGYPLRYQFLDQSFDEIYNNYEKLNKMLSFFTACALLIALIGLFALTALITMQRSREIAVRKVLGASSKDILKLLNKSFFKLTILANILAWPIAYTLSQKWLNNFAYRIEIPVSPFIIATLISLTLTVFTVCIQTLKAASGNPVKALKQE